MSKIVKQAKRCCTQLLRRSRCSRLPFHNLQHTEEVYDAVLKIGIYEKISTEMLEPVLLAALFHDTGNSEIFCDHENLSIRNATKFLEDHDYPHSRIAIVIDCIDATRMPQRPKTVFEKVICDADLFHLGTNQFYAKNKSLRKEWSNSSGMDYTDEAWLALNIDFLSKHNFHTSYGKVVLGPIKDVNVQLLRNLLSKNSGKHEI